MAVLYEQKLAIFLQPTLEVAKPLHPKEKGLPGERTEAIEFYQKTVDRLVATDLPVHSLLNLFVDDRRHLYNDYIHMRYDETKRSPGYQAMSRAIGRHLKKLWGLREKLKATAQLNQ